LKSVHSHVVVFPESEDWPESEERPESEEWMHQAGMKMPRVQAARAAYIKRSGDEILYQWP